MANILQNPLFAPEDTVLPESYFCSPEELVKSTRPHFLKNEHSPPQWDRSDWRIFRMLPMQWFRRLRSNPPDVALFIATGGPTR